MTAQVFTLYGWQNKKTGYTSPPCFVTEGECREAFKHKYGSVEKPIIKRHNAALPSREDIVRMGYIFTIKGYDTSCELWELYGGPTPETVNNIIDRAYDNLDFNQIKLFCHKSLAMVNTLVHFDDIKDKPNKEMLKRQFLSNEKIDEDFFTIFLKYKDSCEE